jgi:hydrogenase nickel incorporation protein HypB
MSQERAIQIEVDVLGANKKVAQQNRAHFASHGVSAFNLVCPALWDLGEEAKVVILSVTEGEDKPLKYPDMFAAASLMLLNKVDLLPHLRFDVVKCNDNARRVNPGMRVLLVSAETGQGMGAWLNWVLGVEA